ncbi:MAG: hypothetical protein DYG91_14235 [Chloroflexi bacterium CFX7]|nr:hypothetical protein [Chloroflexi bacterium CFX7]
MWRARHLPIVAWAWLLVLAPASLMAQRHEDGGSPELEVESFRRIRAFLRAFEDRPRTAQLVAEHSVTCVDPNRFAQQVLNQIRQLRTPEELRQERYADLASRLSDAASRSVVRRVVLLLKAEWYRCDWTDPAMVNLMDLARPPVTRHALSILGPQGHWNVDLGERVAEQRHTEVALNQFFPYANPESWGPSDLFLTAQRFRDLLEDVRGVSIVGRVDGEVWARREPASESPVYLAFRDSAPAEEAPLSAVLVGHVPSRTAILTRLDEWEHGGFLRPTRAVLHYWDNVEVEAEQTCSPRWPAPRSTPRP